MQARDAVLDKAEIAFPSQIFENEFQAFDLGRRQPGVIDIEDLAGGMSEALVLVGLMRILVRFYQGADGKRLEMLARRLHILEQAARFEGDVGKCAERRRRSFG